MSGSSQVVRVLYKACLLASRRLGKEVVRHRTADIFSQSETEWLQAHLPAVISAVAHGESGIKALVRREFRTPGRPGRSDGVEERLDLGFHALRLANSRLTLLEQQAVDPISDKVTKGVRVVIQSRPMADSIVPLEYLFVYKVKIKNESFPEPVQLVSREWRIMDSEGNVQRVTGPGVAGKQPVMERGAEFEYTSYTPLKSRKGTMAGTYHMLATTTGELFDVTVGPLALSPTA